jgi:hypothetical protein
MSLGRALNLSVNSTVVVFEPPAEALDADAEEEEEDLVVVEEGVGVEEGWLSAPAAAVVVGESVRGLTSFTSCR